MNNTKYRKSESQVTIERALLSQGKRIDPQHVES